MCCFQLKVQKSFSNCEKCISSDYCVQVSDRKFGNRVDSLVNVTVKQITDEAVLSSGSFRFAGVTQEEFIAPEPRVCYNFISLFKVCRRNRMKFS